MSFITDIRWRDRTGAQRRSAHNCLLARSLSRQWGGSWLVHGSTALHASTGDVYSHGLRGWLVVAAFDAGLPVPIRRVRLRRLTGMRATLGRRKIRRKTQTPLPKPSRARNMAAQRATVQRTAVRATGPTWQLPVQPRLRVELPAARHVSKPATAPETAPVLVSKPGPPIGRPQGVRNGQDDDPARASLAGR